MGTSCSRDGNGNYAAEYDIDTGGIEETADYQETYAESNGDIIAYSQDEPYLEYVKTIEGHGAGFSPVQYWRCQGD